MRGWGSEMLEEMLLYLRDTDFEFTEYNCDPEWLAADKGMARAAAECAAKTFGLLVIYPEDAKLLALIEKEETSRKGTA